MSALLESHLLGIGRPIWTRSHPKLPLGAQGAPNGPTESQGSQRGTKMTPRKAPWEPKVPTRIPKGSPMWPQGEQREFQRQLNETNKSQNCIHINKIHANSRSTAIQWPTSNNLFICFGNPNPCLRVVQSRRRFFLDMPFWIKTCFNFFLTLLVKIW